MMKQYFDLNEPAVGCLSSIDVAVTYVCVEPLQEEIVMDLSGVDWMIIGAQTNPLVLPQREWVEMLLVEAEDSGTKVFLKKSLNWHEDIHEWPAYDGKWQLRHSIGGECLSQNSPTW